MFESVKNFFRPPEVPSAAAEPFVAADRLRMLAQHFHIGRKLRYYPEYQREIVFHTIVIAYRVNDIFIYSRDAVLLDGEGNVRGFLLPGGKQLSPAALRRFQVLLPDTSDMEKTLDYFTRAELGRAGQFRQGNTITLVAESDQRGIPTLDTKVDRRQMLKEGPYADTSTILVTPEFDTLVLADKRRKQRVQTDTYAYLYPGEGQHAFPCVLADFSEVSLRLSLRDGAHAMPDMNEGDAVIVEFNFGDVDSHHRIQCKVMRRSDESAVLLLEQLYKDGEFGRIKAMDIIEIKTGLLNT